MLHVKKTIACLLAGLSVNLAHAQGPQAPTLPKPISWYVEHAPFPMPSVAPPQFPSRQFPLTDYGATGDGHSLNTLAFQQAIKACAAAGGGHVVVAAGNWLTGPIELLSNVDLHLE